MTIARTATRHLLAGAAALAFLAAPGVAFAQDAVASATASAQQSEHDKLFALFADSDKRGLELNPLGRLFRGDDTDADRLGDYLTDASYYADLRDTQLNAALLQQIDRAKLSPTDQLAYDVFKYNIEQSLKGSTPEIRALTEVRPVNHFSGFHTFYPDFASGSGAAPFKTMVNYEDNLSRHDDYIAITDRSIAKFREGMESGVVETKLTIGNVISQLDTQLAIPIEESQFMGPTTRFPEDFSDADKARLTAAYEAKTKEIYAAHERLRDFLRDEYLPVAREQVGLSAMKGGDKLYEQLIESTTPLPLKADDIHKLGLSEVDRIKGELEKLKEEVGFDGTLTEFFDYVRTDPKFKPKSREALTQSYYDIGKRVDEKIGDYFSLTPKADLVIKPYDPSIEQFQAGGSYQSGTPDGSRPGAFMRFGGTTSFVEGWALYAETLGYDMGFYDAPWARYGTLQDEQLRAMRLVVDTGLHSKGWTRDQAIDFMLENSGMTRTEVVAEVERYIAIPSQALAYKIGALKIQELRDRARAKLGDAFDIKDFHAQVLNTGGLPLPVLEEKIDRWIANGGG